MLPLLLLARNYYHYDFYCYLRTHPLSIESGKSGGAGVKSGAGVNAGTRLLRSLLLLPLYY